MSKTNKRKYEHIEIISQDSECDRSMNYFDRVRLTHRALPEIALEDVDTSVEFLGKKLSFPLIISSMTGGAGEELKKINRNLAIAAEKTGVGLAVGSQRVMFSDPEAKASFALREFAPTTLLFSNLGAVQLNYDFGLKECEEAIKVLNADALYLHLNPLQEAIQPEGDTNFANLSSKIKDIANALSKPLFVKEIGAGVSAEDAKLLANAGVKYIDVAGSGGTSWSRVESHRSDAAKDLGLLFQDWGIPTPLALQEISKLGLDLTLLSSGGVRNGLDILKSLVLGAKVAAMAKPFLKPAEDSVEAVIQVIEQIKQEFRLGMFLLGVDSIEKFETTGKDFLLHHNSSS